MTRADQATGAGGTGPARRTTVAVLVATILVTVTTLLFGIFGAATFVAERNRRSAQLRRETGVEAEQLAISLA